MNAAIFMNKAVEVNHDLDHPVYPDEKENFITSANGCRKPHAQALVQKTAIDMKWIKSVLNSQ